MSFIKKGSAKKLWVPPARQLWASAAGGGGGTPTNVQGILGTDPAAHGTAASSFQQAFAAPVGSGNLVVGAVAYESNDGSANHFLINSVTDDKSNTYTVLDSASIGSGWTVTTFGLANITNGPQTLTFSGTGGDGKGAWWRAMLDEFSNASALDVHHAQAQATPGAGTDTISSAAATTTVNGDLIYGVLLLEGTLPTAIAAGTGFSFLHSANLVDNMPLWAETQIQGTAGSIAGTFSPSGTAPTNTMAAMIAIKP